MSRVSTMISAGPVMAQSVQARAVCDVEKPSRSAMSLDELGMELDRLNDAIHRLADRIEPTLGPDIGSPVGPSETCGPLPQVSPLVATIDSARQRVRAMVAFVQGLRDRVEV